MKFRNYCLIALGEFEGIKDEILKVAETNVTMPHYLDAKGILICTFTSAITVQELTEFFKSNNRSFVVFELDESTSGAHILDERLNSHIFEYLSKGKEELELMASKLIEDIEGTTGNTATRIVVETKPELPDVENLSKAEREELLNKLLDKGKENWDDNDKEILKLISKK